METHWIVWMMKEYGVVESWTKLMIISQDKLISKNPHSFLSDALFISDHGTLFLRPMRTKLIVYNLNNDGGLDYRSTIFGEFAHFLHIYHESGISAVVCHMFYGHLFVILMVELKNDGKGVVVTSWKRFSYCPKALLFVDLVSSRQVNC